MSDDDLIAIHEAGHALMAVALNLALAHVQVGDNPRYDLIDRLNIRDPTRRRDRIRVLMAGGEAERVVFGCEPIGDGSDLQQIAGLLDAHDNEVALRDEVRRLLGLNAGTLRYLAARLLRRGVLTGDEVVALVRGARTFAGAEKVLRGGAPMLCEQQAPPD